MSPFFFHWLLGVGLLAICTRPRIQICVSTNSAVRYPLISPLLKHMVTSFILLTSGNRFCCVLGSSSSRSGWRVLRLTWILAQSPLFPSALMKCSDMRLEVELSQYLLSLEVNMKEWNKLGSDKSFTRLFSLANGLWSTKLNMKGWQLWPRTY